MLCPMSTCCLSCTEVSPSFEQMEVAVNELIERALGGPVSDISELSERVTAWCWLTLKVNCIICMSNIYV